MGRDVKKRDVKRAATSAAEIRTEVLCDDGATEAAL